MSKVRAAYAAIAAMMLLGGCSAPAPMPSTPRPSTESPSPAVATEAQLGSIMAGYASGAREVIENAGECRALSVVGKGALDRTKLVTCYTAEATLSMASATTAGDLASLTAPASMTDLVDETGTELLMLSSIGLERSCGPALGVPDDTKKCRTALGKAFAAYVSLGQLLDRWRPYTGGA